MAENISNTNDHLTCTVLESIQDTDMDPYLQDVIYGRQLVASVSKLEAERYALLITALDLDAVPYSLFQHDPDEEEASFVTIGRKVVFDDAMNGRAVPNIRGHGPAATQLYDTVKYMNVADADVYLSNVRESSCQRLNTKEDQETPEIAIIEGMLNGFPDCCIESYIAINFYNGQLPDGYGEARDIWSQTHPSTYVPCPSCVGMIQIDQ